jgi:hypothetical protein
VSKNCENKGRAKIGKECGERCHRSKINSYRVERERENIPGTSS